MPLKDITQLGERVLAESRAMNAAAYNQLHALARAQQAAMRKVRSDGLALARSLASPAQAPASAEPEPRKPATRSYDDDDAMPDRWLD